MPGHCCYECIRAAPETVLVCVCVTEGEYVGVELSVNLSMLQENYHLYTFCAVNVSLSLAYYL